MIKNYLILAWRTLLRNKSNTFINVSGLSIGIAACLLIFIVIRFELSFDTFHSKKDRIYRVVTEIKNLDGTAYSNGVQAPVPEALRIDFPQLEKVAAINAESNSVITIDKDKPSQKKFKEEDGIFFAEPQLFSIFDISWLAGDPKTALSEPNTAVLTKQTAEKYFGDWKSATGKSILLENRELLKITGILNDPPVNTELAFKVVVSFKTYKERNTTDWYSVGSNNTCFVLLPAGMSKASFDPLMKAFVKRHMPAGDFTNNNILQPLSDIHYNSQFGSFSGRTISKDLIRTLSLIALFLLVIACVNFINLATAQAINRSKEVGIRKVLGSKRLQLVRQFIFETALITVLSVVISVALSKLAMPFLKDLLDIPVAFSFFNNPDIFLFLVTITVLVIFLAGLYPAIILSGYNPIMALKNKVNSQSSKGVNLRRGLVVLQFTIAQILIIGTLVVISQMNYFRNATLGFDKDAILMVPIPQDSVSVTKMETFRNQLLEQPGIKNVSFSFTSPSSNGGWYSGFKFDTAAKETPFQASLKWSDPDYFKTYNLKLIAGRAYAPSDTAREFVVNEKLLSKFGIKDPASVIGKRIDFWDGQLKGNIVGVVKDYFTSSLRDEMAPVVMSTFKAVYRTVGIKMQGQNIKETQAQVQELWNNIYPQYVYESRFLNETIANFYREENQLSMLYKIFAGIAIFISCLGLYGLVSFMAVQRTKEVGIRKVLGASVTNIIYLFSKEFSLLIGIAFLISVPVAWYFMHEWLKNFAYRIDLGLSVFIVTIITSLVIAWLTVGYRAIKAAIANPVKSLRTE
jgi:predicted permease